MRLPEIPRQVPRKHRQQLQMLGLNHTNDYADGELSDCIGVCTTAYPYITTVDEPQLTSLESARVDSDNPPNVVSWFKDVKVKCLYVFKGKIFAAGFNKETRRVEAWYGHPEGDYNYFRRVDNYADSTGTAVALANEWPKQIVTINNKMCIFPDCIYLDTDSTRTVLQRMGRRVLWRCDRVVIFGNGNTREDGCYIRFPAALSIDFRELFKDKLEEGGPGFDVVLNANEGWFVTVLNAYDPTDSQGGLEVMKVGKREIWFKDHVWSGIAAGEEKRTSKNIKDPLYRDVQICDHYEEEDGREDLPAIPPVDYVVAHDNRLYGCSSRDQTIYVSALGDPTDWFSFDTDVGAYAVAVGTDGDFTGACDIGSSVIFTKQHCIHKLLGSVPSEFYIHTVLTEGASEGNGLAMCSCSGVAVFPGEQGLYTYNGATAGKLSNALDPKLISTGTNVQPPASCFDGKRYLMSCNYGSNMRSLFDFDLEHRVCVKRLEAEAIDSIIHLKADTYAAINGKVMKINTGVPIAMDKTWHIVYKPFIDTVAGTFNSTSEIFEKKRYFKIYVRCDVPQGSKIDIYIDDNDEHIHCGTIEGKTKGVQTMVFLTDRFDDCTMSVIGKGPATILSIQREYQQKESSR